MKTLSARKTATVDPLNRELLFWREWEALSKTKLKPKGTEKETHIDRLGH